MTFLQRVMHTSIGLMTLLLFSRCGNAPEAASTQPLPQTWAGIEEQAHGQTVHLFMWTGDPYINQYMEKFVVPAVKQRYGITLDVHAGLGNQLVSMIGTELDAGKAESAADMMWINGETFYQLRQLKALHGPFLNQLPHAQYLNLDSPFINTDFQQKIDGYEAPWGNVQMTLIYDTLRVQKPPQTRAEWTAWVKAHPGRFTFDTKFSGLTFLKGLLMDIAGRETLLGTFNEARYQRYSAELWGLLRELKPYFWKQGRTFPDGVAQLHQLFVNNEVDFTMSNNDGEVDNKVTQGLFPKSTRAYVWQSGTIQNTHYLGIAARAAHKAGAMVVINFLLSPEAQLEKLKPAVWGDGTVLDVRKLPGEWKNRFATVPGRVYAPDRAQIQPFALPELAPEYMIRLAEDFRRNIIE